jgi:hypothetical protein
MIIATAMCVMAGVTLYFGMVRPVLWHADWI